MKSIEEYEIKIGELELKIEEMERTNSIACGLILGGLAHFQWHNWLSSIVIALIASTVAWKFIADRPFTKVSNKITE